MPRARVWCVHVWKPDVVYIQGPGLLLCFFLFLFCLLLKEPVCLCGTACQRECRLSVMCSRNQGQCCY